MEKRRFRKLKHEWSYRLQCEFCGRGFKNMKDDRDHKC